MKRICCIGHITLDKIVTPRQTNYLPGGTAYYFSHAMSRLNGKAAYRLVTALAETEYKAVDEICQKGIDVQVLPSPKTVYFENVYGENTDHRTQRVLAKAAPFTLDALTGVEADIYHLGTLLADDFAPDVMEYLSGRGLLSVDAQGFLRAVCGEQVHAVDWEGKKEALRHVHTLKVNEHEMEVLTGCTNPESAAKELVAWGVKEVVVTLGSLGSLIYAEGEFHRIPAYQPRQVVDATGCGDTYMSAYLYMRACGESCYRAGCFAAAMSTLKLERFGPFAGTEEQILDIIGR